MDISVILCTYNRCGSLRQTLQTFCDLEVPAGLQWELVVADNNSADATRQVCDEFRGRLPLRYLFEPRQGHNNALNRAIQETNAPLLLFTDDDVDVSSRWMSELCDAARRHETAVFFGGRVVPKWESPPPRWLAEHAHGCLWSIAMCYDLGANECVLEQSSDPFVGANLAIRRLAFSDGFRFDSRLGPQGKIAIHGGETDLQRRLMAAGREGYYVPTAVVYHRNPRSRMTEAYLRHHCIGKGMREVRLKQVEACRPMWFGAPRYLWRILARHAWRYVRTRPAGPSALWLSAEMEMAKTWGWIVEFRRQNRFATHDKAGCVSTLGGPGAVRAVANTDPVPSDGSGRLEARVSKSGRATGGEKHLDVVVVVCTYNRSQSLRRTLQSCCALSIPPGLKWELLVVDNNSIDATRRVCEEFSRAIPLRYVFEPRQGKSHALNRAVQETTAPLLLFTDDDVEVQPGWLRCLYETAREHPEASFFGGRILPKWERTPPRWMEQHSKSMLCWITVHLDMGDTVQPVARNVLCFGANLALRRDVFEGGLRFREDIGPRPSEPVRGEEIQVLKHLLRNGCTGLYVPDAIVLHFTPRRRMTEAYLREWCKGAGMLEVRLGEVEDPPGVPRWCGAPRYLWRKMLEGGIRYGLTRWTRPSEVWLRAEIDMAKTWGWISEMRRNAHQKARVK